MRHFLGGEKLIFLIRDIDDAAMAGAPAESCRFVVLRSPGGRFWSMVDVRKHLRRMRGRFQPWAVPSGRREGMFPARYSEIFGLGERLGCSLNLSHSFDAIGAYL